MDNSYFDYREIIGYTTNIPLYKNKSSMPTLTPRQKQILDYIKGYIDKNGFSPTFEEIGRHTKKAFSTIHEHVEALIEKGFLTKKDNSARGIELNEQTEMVKIPLLGTIAAGQPIEAITDQNESIAVPKIKIRSNQKYFALRVAGQSMIEENINDGDIVLVQQTDTAENGEKVVALIDNYEATLKTFYKERGHVRLQPANKNIEPIIIKNNEREIAIQGVVLDVIKNIATEEKEKLVIPSTEKIKKYQKLPLNQLIRGDVVEELKKLQDNSIDLIIADPPYWKVVNEKWDYQWRTENDYINWTKLWIKEIARVVKKTGSFYLFGYFRTLAYLLPEIEKENFSLRQQIIINKGIQAISGRATKNYKMFPNVTESILFFSYYHQPEIKKFLLEKQKERKLTAKQINDAMEVKSNGGGLWSLYTGDNILAQVPTKEQWEKLEKILKFRKPYSEVNFTFNPQMGYTDVWDDINFYKEKRYHPTQKPIKLIDRLIRASSNEGMIVLDPFVGTGSTALACINLKRNYIGIDIDNNYIKIAEERIRNLKNTPTLF